MRNTFSLPAFLGCCFSLPLLACWAAEGSASATGGENLSLSSTARLLARQLEDSNNNRYTSNAFAEGESDYDSYQVAWRVLGFFVDCLAESRWDDDDGNGSGDYETTGEGCKRFVLWAAYVDEGYEGAGIGEYQYWDRSNQAWDTTSCDYGGGGDDDNGNGGGSRCAKMDCHLEDTNWKLLGLFKHRSPDDWMEQLFKHEGKCIWTDDEYSFMKGARKGWPTGCVQSTTTTTLSGRPIYYDMKPVAGGSITLGLYTDDRCIEAYHGTATVSQVAGNPLAEAEASGSGDNGDTDYGDLSVSEAQAVWDSAFDIFKICQPCIAYDLNNYGYNGGDQGSSYGSYSPNGDDDNYSYEAEDFDCYDDADYLNVDQCMKFMAKTAMDTATMRDVVLAHRQGTLVEQVPVQGLDAPHTTFWTRGRSGGDVFFSMLYLIASLSLLTYGIVAFRKARKDANFAPNWSLKQPLVFT